jgi:hypothetical protein
VTTLHPQLTAALQQIPARIETIRLNTLITLSRLGVPVVVWHFLIAGPLPLTVEALAPTGARGLTATEHSPPVPDPLLSSLSVSPLD